MTDLDSIDVLDRYRPIVDDFSAFLRTCNTPLSQTVRVNRTNATVSEVQDALRDGAITSRLLDWSEDILEVGTETPGSTLPDFLGWTTSQDATSCLPAPVLDPSPGERIWDACAAPGSKTSHLVDLMEDRGFVFATDASLGRLSALRFNTERVGATCVGVDHVDARHVSRDWFDGRGFDGTLVDAPCSCEGTVRKQPEALDDWSLDQIRSLAQLQMGILRRAVELTRVGGRVVYSTCTFAPEENEAVIDHILRECPCKLETFELPLQSRQGITDWDGAEFDPALASTRRIYPHHNDTGGFFIAKLRVVG